MYKPGLSGKQLGVRSKNFWVINCFFSFVSVVRLHADSWKQVYDKAGLFSSDLDAHREAVTLNWLTLIELGDLYKSHKKI